MGEEMTFACICGGRSLGWRPQDDGRRCMRMMNHSFYLLQHRTTRCGQTCADDSHQHGPHSELPKPMRHSAHVAVEGEEAYCLRAAAVAAAACGMQCDMQLLTSLPCRGSQRCRLRRRYAKELLQTATSDALVAAATAALTAALSEAAARRRCRPKQQQES
eukprot:357523-Chlamydomonas_euryale.AAC.5